MVQQSSPKANVLTSWGARPRNALSTIGLVSMVIAYAALIAGTALGVLLSRIPDVSDLRTISAWVGIALATISAALAVVLCVLGLVQAHRFQGVGRASAIVGLVGGVAILALWGPIFSWVFALVLLPDQA